MSSGIRPSCCWTRDRNLLIISSGQLLDNSVYAAVRASVCDVNIKHGRYSLLGVYERAYTFGQYSARKSTQIILGDWKCSLARSNEETVVTIFYRKTSIGCRKNIHFLGNLVLSVCIKATKVSNRWCTGLNLSIVTSWTWLVWIIYNGVTILVICLVCCRLLTVICSSGSILIICLVCSSVVS